MSYEEFVQLIMSKLKSSANESQSELFDLLGYEHFEFIGYIIEHKKSIFALNSAAKATKIFESKHLQIANFKANALM